MRISPPPPPLYLFHSPCKPLSPPNEASTEAPIFPSSPSCHTSVWDSYSVNTPWKSLKLLTVSASPRHSRCTFPFPTPAKSRAAPSHLQSCSSAHLHPRSCFFPCNCHLPMPAPLQSTSEDPFPFVDPADPSVCHLPSPAAHDRSCPLSCLTILSCQRTQPKQPSPRLSAPSSANSCSSSQRLQQQAQADSQRSSLLLRLSQPSKFSKSSGPPSSIYGPVLKPNFGPRNQQSKLVNFINPVRNFSLGSSPLEAKFRAQAREAKPNRKFNPSPAICCGLARLVGPARVSIDVVENSDFGRRRVAIAVIQSPLLIKSLVDSGG